MSRSSFEEDLLCPVCCDIFVNPVVLSCSHSICEDCIQRFWENKKLKECPVCRRRSSKEHPPLNLVLRNLCETYQQKPSQRSSFGGETVCGVHNEKLKLFCLDDQQPVCLVCRDSRKHANHRFCPIDEAVMDNKKMLKVALERLKEKQRIFENFKQSCNEDDQQIKFNAEDAEKQIKEEFEELHQFLRDEEAARIKALREEEKRRCQKIKQEIKEISKHISSLSCTIRDIEEQMKAEDVSFLQNINATLQRAQCNPPVSKPNPAVINFSNHLTNLKFTVLQKMQENFGKTSYFNSHQSEFHFDLAAMDIFDNPEKYEEYEDFPTGGGNSTNIVWVPQFNEDQSPWEVHPVRTNIPEFPQTHVRSSRGRGRNLRKGPPTSCWSSRYDHL
ncbi:E3 ubiquitin-protein ligase TRIM35-like [Labeo rohita]|uniref:E3 ubiquitin-protein ligase TRIM35-like n=1 Tax=Labeo rohita TaxID=84645 RepID=UPI0021E2BEC9|nr:E3 ubiquitin-protein ligase TRIM35-like [Labeo rohita]